MNLEKNKMEFGKNSNGFHRALYIYIAKRNSGPAFN